MEEGEGGVMKLDKKGPIFQESGPTYEMDVYCNEDGSTTADEFLFTTSKD